ncbi:MAG: HAD family hydrolase [Microlunatus sp.]|nr:HAD family hydrolase [Microlunatus sp.]
MRPKLIVSDLDGTFLSPDGSVSDRNLAAVAAAERAGIPVVFATGRPIRLLGPIRGLRRTQATVIASNGAMTYDLGRDTVLSMSSIPCALAAEAFADLRNQVSDVAFGVDTGIRAGYEPAYLSYDGSTFNIRDDPERYVGELSELVADGEFVKLLVLREGADADEFTGHVRKILGDRLAATHSSTQRALVEVSAAGVSKAATLAALCERLGVAPEEVAAFGDMPNDLEMLRSVGMPYVMADAHPDLLALQGAAVIGSNADSAVGATIESLVA